MSSVCAQDLETGVPVAEIKRTAGDFEKAVFAEADDVVLMSHNGEYEGTDNDLELKLSADGLALITHHGFGVVSIKAKYKINADETIVVTTLGGRSWLPMPWSIKEGMLLIRPPAKQVLFDAARKAGIAEDELTDENYKKEYEQWPLLQIERRKPHVEDKKILAKLGIQRVEKELSQISNHSWAGTYYAPDFDHQHCLRIAPQKGAVFVQHSGTRDQLGKISSFDVGKIEYVNGEVHIAWKQSDMPPPIESDFVVVNWGRERFLVPFARIHAFCIETRKQPGAAFSELRLSNEGKAELAGGPEVPEQFQKYLGLPAIDARVVAAHAPSRKKTDADFSVYQQSVELNVGEEDHVFVGMEFTVVKGIRRELSVTKVGKKTCDAVFRSKVASGDKFFAIKSGWKVRTPVFE